MWIMAMVWGCGSLEAENQRLHELREAAVVRAVALEARVTELEAENRQLYEQLEEAEPCTTDREQGADPSGSLPPDPSQVCTHDGEQRFTWRGGRLDMSSLERTGRIVIHKTPDDTFDGMALSAVRKDTLLDTCGLKNGDVVHSINGYELTDVAKTMEAYHALQAAESLTIALTRRGSPMTLEIHGP